MSESTNGVATLEAPAAAPAKRKAKPASKPRAEKAKLRTTQVRMLKLLAKKERATRQQLVIAACPGRENPQLDGTHLGNINEKDRKYEKATGYTSLLSLGYVRHKVFDIDGKKENWYEITAAGRKALVSVK